MKATLTSKEIAYSGIFGAAALLLPLIFHLIHLGHVFMPMYIPLVLLAFFVRPKIVMVTSLVTPLISSLLSGMPPLYPPVAIFMSIELAIMGGIIAACKQRFPHMATLLVLIPVLLLGRLLYVGLVYTFYGLFGLPATFMASVSFLAGWPGIIVMLLVIPFVVKAYQKINKPEKSHGEVMGL